jgi:hypothetical protein
MAKRLSTPPPTSRSRNPPPGPATALASRVPTHEEIARRAFELYVARGQDEGSDVSDWLRAQSELAAASPRH